MASLAALQAEPVPFSAARYLSSSRLTISRAAPLMSRALAQMALQRVSSDGFMLTNCRCRVRTSFHLEAAESPANDRTNESSGAWILLLAATASTVGLLMPPRSVPSVDAYVDASASVGCFHRACMSSSRESRMSI